MGETLLENRAGESYPNAFRNLPQWPSCPPPLLPRFMLQLQLPHFLRRSHFKEARAAARCQLQTSAI